MKKNNLYDANNSEDDFKHDPEAQDNTKKYRLPFALCKAHGIATQDWWTPRDAWKALENGGVVDDVSEEYEEYFKKLKKEKNKQYQERAKRKRKQLKDSEHNPDKGYVHQKGSIAGAKKGAPMDFKSADSGNVNPYYNYNQIGYSHNCQTCVAVYVARRQGYDVRALPNLNNKNIYRLSYNTALAYIDANGMHPKRDSILGVKDLDRKVKSNRIYSVEFNWKGRRSGHIITVERGEDGNVRLYDPQTNSIIKGDEMRKYLSRTRNVEIMDLTDCTLDEAFCDKIMKKVNR
jgi:hypothetical protein